MNYKEILDELKAMSDPEVVACKARYGITPAKAYGVSIPKLREMAKRLGTDHSLALRLWKKNARETRILASMIDDPSKITEEQMEDWVKEFDYWEICDQCCMNLFEDTEYAYQKCVEWSSRKREFEKRAGFALMARLAVSDKNAGDESFRPFLPIIKRGAIDERNYVKKAVNWALRQIGKRNLELNKEAIETARQIKKMDSRSAKWVASDALRELTGEPVQKRLRKKARG